ncbi:MAG: lipopolysaccharide biosynthesis protein RfbH [Lentisphaeria bacterium]|nr:lipopolysaccharide biosynthesis protein RfbH [Lentisphaeria bacterium]
MDRITQLRDSILKQVAEYYELVHKPDQTAPFSPGESRIGYAGRVFGAEEMVQLVEASLEFWLTAGRWTAEWEQGLADFLGVPAVLSVNSGSSANFLALQALTVPQLGERQIRRGDEVLTVACGFPTTVSPIVQYGAVPVFVDVDAATGNVDTEQLEAARSSQTKAVMLAHTLGNPFDLKRVKDFCDRYGLWLVEDNCDALGSLYQGRLTGTFGDIGTSSFYPPHHLTTGEGSAVYTRNSELHRILLSLRDWGRDCHCPTGMDNCCGNRFSGQYGTLPPGYDHKYVYRHFGSNLKMTDLQAAIGCAQLKRLPEFIRKRRENFAFLRDALADLPQIRIMEATPGSEPSWFVFLMTLTPDAGKERNDLARFLESRRIQTRNLFAGNLTRHPCFDGLVPGRDYRIAAPLIRTDRLMNDALWIGVYPGMTGEKLDYMASSVREFFGK